jgi:hypothetical protein
MEYLGQSHGQLKAHFHHYILFFGKRIIVLSINVYIYTQILERQKAKN